MKRYLIILLLPVVSLFFSACSDDDELSATSVVRETTTEENDFDRWLTRNYVEPYNILFKYRFEDIESNMDYYLTPASYEQSIAMAKLVLHMCLEAYNEITGDTEFIKSYFPKILFLVGSYAYKTNGSLVLGTAEAGAKITLYNVDGLVPTAVNAKTSYFKTLHHEFGHILNQTKPYSTDFSEISGPDYVQDQCFEIYTTDEMALQAGFISPYASKSDSEDFVELISLYVNRSADEWEEMLTTAGSSGREKIEAKFEIVYNYMKDSWSIDLNELRDIVLRRAAEAPYLDFESLD
ncbi:putative zinc-binding metallopeptidase [uncultured Alistipes sp.]|uniref:zinc-binding metallopeptidase n=1 Tax=uncultured Alistipes sp. TaxID=538949 RepID=UPI002627B2FF|nr:putative zinc-binding metallopeptidase [uncultured Alistipes sp.]